MVSAPTLTISEVIKMDQVSNREAQNLLMEEQEADLVQHLVNKEEHLTSKLKKTMLLVQAHIHLAGISIFCCTYFRYGIPCVHEHRFERGLFNTTDTRNAMD